MESFDMKKDTRVGGKRGLANLALVTCVNHFVDLFEFQFLFLLRLISCWCRDIRSFGGTFRRPHPFTIVPFVSLQGELRGKPPIANSTNKRLPFRRPIRNVTNVFLSLDFRLERFIGSLERQTVVIFDAR